MSRPGRDKVPQTAGTGPAWGYHAYEYGLVLGNLLQDVASEEAAWESPTEGSVSRSHGHCEALAWLLGSARCSRQRVQRLPNTLISKTSARLAATASPALANKARPASPLAV
jgi:hypothetical protein